MDRLIVTKVPCCVCHSAGKVRRFMFLTRDCPVCDGEGQRKVVYSSAFTDEDRDMVLRHAEAGTMPLQANLVSNASGIGGAGQSLLGFKLF